MEMESMLDSSEQVERIAATVEEARRDEDLRVRLAIVERELAELKAAARSVEAAAAQKPLEGLRRTLPAATTALLAKRGLDEGPVTVSSLDDALSGLGLEQRIAVKSQLHRMGAII